MGNRTEESLQRLYALRRECFRKHGIRYVGRVNSIKKLEEILADPYDAKMATWRRWSKIDPFDFRAKGITPKKGAYIKWKTRLPSERKYYRCVGRFVEMIDSEFCYVTYPLWLGNGYKNKKVRISIFQIVDYSEEK